MNRQTSLRPAEGGKFHKPVTTAIPERWELRPGDLVRCTLVRGNDAPNKTTGVVRGYVKDSAFKGRVIVEHTSTTKIAGSYFTIQRVLPRDTLRLIPPAPKEMETIRLQSEPIHKTYGEIEKLAGEQVLEGRGPGHPLFTIRPRIDWRSGVPQSKQQNALVDGRVYPEGVMPVGAIFTCSKGGLKFHKVSATFVESYGDGWISKSRLPVTPQCLRLFCGMAPVRPRDQVVLDGTPVKIVELPPGKDVASLSVDEASAYVGGVTAGAIEFECVAGELLCRAP